MWIIFNKQLSLNTFSWSRLLRFEWAEPGDDVDGDGDGEYGHQDEGPNSERERSHEGKEVDSFAGMGDVQDGDAGVEERHGEVNHLGSLRGDGEISDGHVRSLLKDLADHSSPVSFLVLRAVTIRNGDLGINQGFNLTPYIDKLP